MAYSTIKDSGSVCLLIVLLPHGYKMAAMVPTTVVKQEERISAKGMSLCFSIQGEIFLRNFPWVIRTDQMLVIAPEQSLGSPFYARSNLVDAGARGDETRGAVFTAWYRSIYYLVQYFTILVTSTTILMCSC